MIEHWLVDRARKHKPVRKTEVACHRKHRIRGGVARRIAVKRSRNSLSLASSPGNSPLPLADRSIRCTAQESQGTRSPDYLDGKIRSPVLRVRPQGPTSKERCHTRMERSSASAGLGNPSVPFRLCAGDTDTGGWLFPE